jgi:apolipoprotein N-acyltransferase
VTGFPWDLLGYTQVDNAVLTTLAPLGGVMLLSFVIAAANAAVVCLLPGIGRRSWRWAIFVGGAILLLQAGSFYHPAADDAGHVAMLLQENLAVGAEGRDLVPYPMAKKYEDFTRLSLNPEHDKSGVLAHPELIVWPEAPAEFITSDPQFRVQLSNLARTAHEPVIVGSVGVDFDPASERGYHEFGSAAVFGSDSSFLGRYDKIHRVPWGEYVPYKQFFGFAGQLISGVGNMEAGTEHKLFRLNDHNVGIFICYESIFGDEVRQFVRNGAELLVNISDDGWYGDSGAPWQHLDMARMRAIENRRWVLRDTNTGITTAIDPHGRGIFTTPRHVRAAFDFGFGYRSSVTMYTLHGDWFAWSCVAVVAGFVLWPPVRRQRTFH